MMNNEIKNYFDFLLYIGITSNETLEKIFQLLSSKYNDKSNKEKDIDNLLSSLTCDYLKSLDKKSLELVGKNIYQQYVINKMTSELKTIKKVLIVRYNFFRRKLKKYFNKWRLLTINSNICIHSSFNKTSSYKSLKTKSDSKKNIFNTKHFMDKLDFYSDKKKENSDKIKLMMESDIINQCTFKPSLKYTYRRNNSKKNINVLENKIKKYENESMKSYKIFCDDNINTNINCNNNINKNNKNEYKIKRKTYSPKINKNNIKQRNNYYLYKNPKTADTKYKKAFKV